MEQVYREKTECCGCAHCAYCCPTGAISMEEKEGFRYPVIDQTKCVDCGLCRKTCPFITASPQHNEKSQAFAVKHKDENTVKSSSSGGAFTALSNVILSENGVIFGADFDENMAVRHACACTPGQRDRMRGAKYVQSITDDVFCGIKEALIEQKPVLFTGTPCQVAAVKKAFPNEEGLYTVDIICHGVPSPVVWKSYVSFIEEKYGKKLTYYSFRDKTKGWRNYASRLFFEDGTQVEHNDITGCFIELFRYDVCLRPACTKCPYASLERMGDITIGDFWGIEHIMPEISDNKGVSAVMVNTSKGQVLLEKASACLSLYPCTKEDAGKKQPNLFHPSSFSNKAHDFQQDYQKLPFEKVLKKYTRVGIKRRGIDFIKTVLK